MAGGGVGAILFPHVVWVVPQLTVVSVLGITRSKQGERLGISGS